MERRIVLCIGNPDRGDDSIGRRVAALLRSAMAELEVVECIGEATLVLDALEGALVAIIVDASLSGAAPGTVRRFDLHGERPALSGDIGWSSHGFGLAEAIGLARALGGLPPVCVLFAIEGVSFAPGAALSAGAAAGAAEAARLILAECAPDRQLSGQASSFDGKIDRPCPRDGKTL
ncbi:hydrogenase maturation protease [Methylosinus sp. H3A]|uniref:hydrogenase maturation protease n=1 Tax=Methylosinus sp. H3A TaxID=2785786 RepID=UPI0018C2FB98|nr:hydrogenase maturation protease [Methylosinus sp. H3A]MBG0811336.1 hydrogenase maturation protease [Methylosinus sp. H3A]